METGITFPRFSQNAIPLWAREDPDVLALYRGELAFRVRALHAKPERRGSLTEQARKRQRALNTR